MCEIIVISAGKINIDRSIERERQIEIYFVNNKIFHPVLFYAEDLGLINMTFSQSY